jgi:hypothetical protein
VRRSPVVRTVAWSAGAVVMAALLVGGLAVPGDIAKNGDVAAALIPAIERRVPKHLPLVFHGETGVDGYTPEALALALDRAGYDVRVPASDAYRFGAWRSRRPHGPATQLYLESVGDTMAPPVPGARRVAVGAPTTGALTGTRRLTVWIAPSVRA